jgi:hypothetical protein
MDLNRIECANKKMHLSQTVQPDLEPDVDEPRSLLIGTLINSG